MMRLRYWVAAVGVCVAAGAIFFMRSPCMELFPVHDSSILVDAESKELLSRLRADYAAGAGITAQPIDVVSIVGRSATVRIAAPRHWVNNSAYAAVWQGVYARHHGRDARTCVWARIVWTGGSTNVDCCLPHL